VLGKVIYENDKLVEGTHTQSSILVYNKPSAPADFVTKSYPLTDEGHVELVWGTSNLGGLIFNRYEVRPNSQHTANTYTITDFDTKIKDLDYDNDLLFQATPPVGGSNNNDSFFTYNSKQMRVGKKWWNFAVRVVTKKQNGEEVFGDWSFSLNAPCKKPTKPTEMSVAKTLYYPNNIPKVEFLSRPGILYMTMPLSNRYDQAEFWGGIGVDQDYRLAYEVSSDNGVSWVSPSTKATNTIFPSDDINGLHVWGASGQELTPTTTTTTEGTVEQYTFITDNTILVGTEYKFIIRRVGYNLFNPNGSLTLVKSDASNIVLNTSFEVTPQEHLYDPVNTVYNAQPLLGVISTPSNTKITLNWTAASKTLLRGLTLDRYEVQLNEGLNPVLNEVSWVTVNIVNGVTTYAYEFSQFNGLPLVNGTTYTLSVRTVCKHTKKDISGTIITNTFTGTPVSVPNIPYVKAEAPTIKNITPLSYPDSGKIEIEWAALALSNKGGLAVTKYQVRYIKYYTTTTNIQLTSVWDDVIVTQQDVVFYKKQYGGLENGTKYSVEVRAITEHVYLVNTEVEGTIAIMNNIIPREIPPAPTIVSSPVKGDGSLGLTWDYNIASQTKGLLSFKTFKRDSINPDGSIKATVDDTASYTSVGNEFSYTFPGLTNGIKYKLTVVPVLVMAVTEELIYGSRLEISSVPYKQASAPTNLITTPGDKNILLQWDAVPEASLGGLALQNYEVKNNTDPNAVWISTGTNLNYDFPSLNNGTTYNMSVRAVTEFKDSTESDPSKKYTFNDIKGSFAATSAIPFVKPGTIPNTASSKIVAVSTNGFLSLSFNEPADVNNSKFTQFYEYSINYTPAGGSLVIGNYISTNNTGIKDIKYIGQNSFTLNLRAYIFNPNDGSRVNGNVVSVSNLRNIVVSSPQNLNGTIGDQSVTLTWNIVEGASSYKVYIKTRQGISVPIEKISVDTNSYKFEFLDNGIAYEFGVVSVYAGDEEGSAATISKTPMATARVVLSEKSTDFLNLTINSGGSTSVNIFVEAYYYTISTITTTEGPSQEEVLVQVSRKEITNIYTTNVNTDTLVPIKVQKTGIDDNVYIRNYFDVTITNTMGSNRYFIKIPEQI
jgi:hypothetical protein